MQTNSRHVQKKSFLLPLTLLTTKIGNADILFAGYLVRLIK